MNILGSLVGAPPTEFTSRKLGDDNLQAIASAINQAFNPMASIFGPMFGAQMPMLGNVNPLTALFAQNR